MPRNAQPAHHELDLWLEPRPTFWSEFERSRKGNLWRQWEDKTLTVFQRSDGLYGWCIAGNGATRYSSRGFDSEAIALTALAKAVERLAAFETA